ncbi:type II pantothenate kinase [Falsibacillus albus]|uniref:Type II pantothenate kinase n=1 Tax=Falsibacillus albus TaxID=2478915 RepID=A0A3L7JY47_9BACI|nr:type II pantothenate kinase [Falsibacillus albus]RLQ93362.1 type II pantothenate kinase [Falsibacillus albus]
MNTIGIDAGGSLIKIAYIENAHLHTKMFANDELGSLQSWLAILGGSSRFILTGGKAQKLKSVLGKGEVIQEFEATALGTDHLLMKTQKKPAGYILVMIGTGTSIQLVTEHKQLRLLGSGIGGGTIVGLGNLLTGSSDYHQLIQMADDGDRSRLDLLVKDIFESEDTPIPGELTASNFGKPGGIFGVRKEDQIAAVMNMVAETIVLLATQAAQTHQLKDIVFVGSTLNGNNFLKERLTMFQDMLDYKAHFIDRGSFAGAIGAMLWKRRQD